MLFLNLDGIEEIYVGNEMRKKQALSAQIQRCLFLLRKPVKSGATFLNYSQNMSHRKTTEGLLGFCCYYQKII